MKEADVVIGVGAAATPLWLQYFENYGEDYILAAGIVLITIRVVIAFREWRSKKK